MIVGDLRFKHEVIIEVEQAYHKWNDNIGGRLWGGAGRCRTDRKVRRQKGEEEDEEHVGGNGEKDGEDKDRQVQR